MLLTKPIICCCAYKCLQHPLPTAGPALPCLWSGTGNSELRVLDADRLWFSLASGLFNTAWIAYALPQRSRKRLSRLGLSAIRRWLGQARGSKAGHGASVLFVLLQGGFTCPGGRIQTPPGGTVHAQLQSFVPPNHPRTAAGSQMAQNRLSQRGRPRQQGLAVRAPDSCVLFPALSLPHQAA